MSHFSVGIIHKEDESIEEILTPYNEQVEEGDWYAEFDVEVKAEETEEYRKRELKLNTSLDEHKKDEYKKMDIETFMQEYSGYLKNDKGGWGYWWNPDSQWDWYMIGGRWRGMLKLKEGAKAFMKGDRMISESSEVPREGYVDSVLFKDIDWEGMEDDLLSSAKDSWNEYELAKERGALKENFWQFGVYKDETKEHYIKRVSKFETASLIVDGGWLDVWSVDRLDAGLDVNGDEKVGIIRSEGFMAYLRGIAERHPNDVFTIVDCHR